MPAILHASQKIVARDTHRFRVCCNGRRWGKTLLAVLEMIGKAVAKDGNDCVYIAPTYQQARDLAWAELMRVVAPFAKNINETRLECIVPTKDGGTSRIVLRGWENIETLRGTKIAFVVIDEIASMRNWLENWQTVVRPTLTDLRGEGLFISTPSGYNHFYDLFMEEKRDPDYKSFHFTTYDNPFIPVDEIDKAKKELTEDRFAQEYLADFRKTEGLVYKEFDRKKHVTSGKPKKIVWSLGGIDFGYQNPTAVLSILKDDEGAFWIMDEWYKRGKTNGEVIEYVKTLGFNRIYADPAEPDRIEEMRRAGFNMMEVSKDVVKGIDSVRSLLKNGKLFVHESCVNTILEFETYRYKDKRPDSNEPEEPVKENDHACFVRGTTVNGRNIEEVGSCTGIRHVYEYEIAGEKIIATENHPVLTQRGFVAIDALRYNDIIWQRQKSLFMQVCGGIATPKAKGVIFAFISAIIRRTKEANDRDCTALSGNKHMVKYLLGSMFIILMGILSIIHSIILLLLTAVNTYLCTWMKRTEQERESILKMLYGRPPYGLKQKKANVGEKKSEKQTHTFSTIIQPSHDAVICVDENIKQKVTDATDSAILTVVRKRYVGLEPVFNLYTKSGMYHANGIMVSNCDALRYALFMQNPEPDKVVRKELRFDGMITY